MFTSMMATVLDTKGWVNLVNSTMGIGSFPGAISILTRNWGTTQEDYRFSTDVNLSLMEWKEVVSRRSMKDRTKLAKKKLCIELATEVK